MPSLDVAERHLEELRDILAAHVPDCDVLAFGSRVRGAARPTSDLDLCLVGEEPLSLERMASLRLALSESNLPMMVDLTDWHLLSDGFRAVVSAEHIAVQRRTAPLPVPAPRVP